MTIAFLDTSLLLRHILKESDPYPHFAKFQKIYASELLRVEALRNIDRLRIQYGWEPEAVATRIQLLTALSPGIEFIPLQSSILRRAAEPFPTSIKTLDALHLATAILWQEQLNQPLLFLTHDARQGHAARACGLGVEGF